MKVLLVNGSSRENGCTDRALKEVAKALNAEGIETEFFFIGSAPIADCIGCGSCRVKGKCIFDDVAVRLAEKAADFDGFVFVTPEYNHAPPAALKNALDYLFHEWNNKSAGFVSYGAMGGVRAVQELRHIMGALMIADVRTQVTLSLFTDFEKMSVFRPDPRHEKTVNTMLDQIVACGTALKPLRQND